MPQLGRDALRSGAVVADGKVVLRRTWPQRIVMLACIGVIGSALVAAWFVQNLYVAVADIPRVQISGDLLITETAPGAPVNFVVIGNDSALGIDPDDPIHIGRVYDDRGTHNADSISLVRVDPVARQVWVLSIPRDLVVDVPGSREWKINAAALIGGPELLVQTITETLGVQLNHYVQLDFLAFQAVVDQLDGVPVWFANPARDLESGLDVPVGGCVVMHGSAALSYVRSRNYEEFIDDEWIAIDNEQPDLARIRRQQDFLVLAIDRAIGRGARNLTTMSSLINAGAQSVVLDQGLTPSELIDLAEAFTDFDPDSLQRFSLEVLPERNYSDLGDVAHFVEGPTNQEILAIFRGAADGLAPYDVRFSVVGPDTLVVDNDAEILTAIGFIITDLRQPITSAGPSVVVHPPGAIAEAELLARFVVPVPALVEDSTATEITLVLGRDHEQISFFLAPDLDETREAIAAHGEVDLPDVGTTSANSGSTSSTSPSIAAVDAATNSTTVVPNIAQAGAIGRVPDGETCG